MDVLNIRKETVTQDRIQHISKQFLLRQQGMWSIWGANKTLFLLFASEQQKEEQKIIVGGNNFD